MQGFTYSVDLAETTALAPAEPSTAVAGDAANPVQLVGGDAADQIKRADLKLIAEIERLPAQSAILRELFRCEHVGVGPVLDVKVVPDECAVGTDDRPLSA